MPSCAVVKPAPSLTSLPTAEGPNKRIFDGREKGTGKGPLREVIY